MIVPRRVRLNPCDYLYCAHHSLMTRRGQGGNVAFMMLEAQGRVDPARTCEALRRVYECHPVALGRLKVSILQGRPYWQLPADISLAAREAAVNMLAYEDLRGEPNWDVRLETMCRLRFIADWDVAAGPLVRLEQYDLPGERTRFCIRWPHSLMDAEGAQWFLSEMDRLDRSASEASSNGLLADDAVVDPLAGVSLRKRWRLFREAYREQQGHAKLRAAQLLHGRDVGLIDQSYLHRLYGPAAAERLKRRAKETTPPGPGLYARFLGACVIRALHRLHTERHVSTEVYVIPLPMRVGSTRATADLRRPVPGNFLVALALFVKPDVVEDPHALGAEIMRQFLAYQRGQGDIAQWSMIWLVSRLRFSQYKLLLRLPVGLDRYASGFSYYGEIDPPLRTLCGASVVNMFGCAPMGVPPGLNPAFSKFGDCLNFSLAWARPYVPDEIAERFALLIEQEAALATR